MNFLIIVYKGIGDVILTIPLIKAIKRNFKDSKVFFLTKKYSADILKNNPWIDEVLIRENLKISYLRSLNIDVSIDYMLSSSSAFYSLLSGAKKRIAFWRHWGFLVYNYMIKSEWDGYNVIKKFEYLKPFGIDWRSISDIKPEIYPSKDDEEKVKEVFKKNEIDLNKDKIVSFDITSPRAQRQPRSEIFIYCADRLLDLGFKTVFLPAVWDREYVFRSINNYSLYPSKHIIIDSFNLMQLASAISYSSIHIGTSSAPMHIAVSFNVPTFTLYSEVINPISWTPPLEIHGYMQSKLDLFHKEEVWSKIKNHVKKINIIG